MSSSVKIFILLNQIVAVGLRLLSNVMEANKELQIAKRYYGVYYYFSII